MLLLTTTMSMTTTTMSVAGVVPMNDDGDDPAGDGYRMWRLVRYVGRTEDDDGVRRYLMIAAHIDGDGQCQMIGW